MVRAKNNSSGSVPTDPITSGPGNAVKANPKNHAVRRNEVIAVTPDGDGGMVQPGQFGTSDQFPGRNAPNRASKGTAASEPDPDTINRGYSEITPGNVPSVSSVTSGNRLMFGVDPGPLSLDGGGQPNVDSPMIPTYPSGDTGD